jgi:4-diphosphocytidyl-2-C-methyl-D-erythritol kinase
MTPLSFHAPAKLNLFLHITGRRKDGYHEISSCFLKLQHLYDIIEIYPADTITCEVKSSKEVVALEDNIILKAIRKLPKPPTGARVVLHKQIPVAAGLGGGSSDAAAILQGLNQFWNLGLTLPQLQSIGLSLGADIPFFLQPASMALVKGIGEIIIPTSALHEPLYALLVNPRIPCATPEIFRAYRELTPIISVIAEEEKLTLNTIRAGRNDLTNAAIQKVPVITQILSELSNTNPITARMSGSGATCFAIFNSQEKAVEAHKYIQNKFPHYWAYSERLS